MAKIRGAKWGATVAAQDIYEQSSTQQHKLGERLVIGDRVFRYMKAGSSNLSAGYVVGAPCTLTSEDTVTVAHGIGTTVVTITASGVSANDFAEGYLVVDEGTGAGETYKIRSNTATDSDGLIQVTLYDGLKTAWDTSDTDVTLIPSPYKDVIVCPTDGIILPVGVPLIAVTANYYFWGQTWGPCGVKIDGTAGALGAAIDERLLGLSGSTAGALDVYKAVDSDGPGPSIVGMVMLDSADHTDTKIEPVYLMLCP